MEVWKCGSMGVHRPCADAVPDNPGWRKRLKHFSKTEAFFNHRSFSVGGSVGGSVSKVRVK